MCLHEWQAVEDSLMRQCMCAMQWQTWCKRVYKREAASGILSDVLGCVYTHLREAEEDYRVHACVQAGLRNMLV